MTLKIEVNVPQDQIEGGTAALYLAKAMTAIGYSRYAAAAVEAEDEGRGAAGKSLYTVAEMAAKVAAGLPKEPAKEPAAEPEPIRYIGQASGGKRRTKAEMAQDEEATKLLAVVGLDEARFNAALDKAGGDWDAVMADLRAAAAAKAEEPEAPQANISTGEERVDPAAEDEPAEDDGEVYTHDDVRAALGDYAAKFGMPAAQKNGPKLMGADKISAIPDDQAALRKAVTAIRNAINEKGEA